MKVEAWIFYVTAIFCALVTPAYWIITDNANDGMGGDWTGTTALAMTTLLVAMIGFYLGFHARKMTKEGTPRPEDRKEAEIVEGAGELGFFPPYSWWPLWCGATFALGVFGIAIGAWWLFVIAGILGLLACQGWIFEYYRGEHAH